MCLPVGEIPAGTNAHAAVKRICVRDASKPRPITTPPGILTECADDILDDPGTDLIVEVVDNPAASYDIVTRALRKGIPVVSGSKEIGRAHV